MYYSPSIRIHQSRPRTRIHTHTYTHTHTLLYKPAHRRGIYHRIRPRVFISPWEKSWAKYGKIGIPFPFPGPFSRENDETWHEERTLADEEVGRDGVERQRFHDLGGWKLAKRRFTETVSSVEGRGEVAFICSWKTKAEQQGLRSLFITLDGGCVPLLASCHLRHPSNRRSP